MDLLAPASLRASCPDLAPGPFVLVAAAGPDAQAAAQMAGALADCGHRVVGPIARAAAALDLAEQAPVTRAVVYSRLAGRRDGRQLAKDLRARFGVETLLIARN